MKTPTIKTIERQFPNQWVLIGYRDERWGTLEGRCAQGWQETARSRRGNRQEQRQETVFFLQRNSCIAKYGFRTVVRTLSEILERNQLQPLPIGVGNGFRRPRPPNRACGSPAHGSPVSGFLIGIGSLASRLPSW